MPLITTEGLVQKATYVTVPPTRGGCVWIGPSPSDAELFTLLALDTDSAAEREHKASMLQALATGMAERLPVVVYHDDSSGVVVHVVLTPAGF